MYKNACHKWKPTILKEEQVQDITCTYVPVYLKTEKIRFFKKLKKTEKKTDRIG